MADLKELEDLVQLCKKHRISHLKAGEYEFQIELPESEEASKATREINEILSKVRNVSDEEILFDAMAGLEDLNNANN